jgi:prophage tail gpP-like protein
MSNVKLKINDLIYTGWQSVMVVRSIETMAGRFSLNLTDNAPFVVPKSSAVELFLNDEKIISGYSDSINYEISSNEYSLSIDGRDKTGDLMDCSTLIPSQELINVTLKEIIDSVIEPFGITAIYNQNPADKFKKFSLQQESAYEAIERATRLRGVLASSNQDGQIIIQEYGAQRANDSIVMGLNVLSASSRFNDINRFSEYLVYGQQSGDDDLSLNEIMRPQGFSKDFGISRYRPKIVIAEGSINTAMAQKRAEWEAAIRAARAVDIEVTLQGWTQSSGNLWRENMIVKTILPDHGINSDMLIKEISYSLDLNSGEKTRIILVRPDAYKLQPNIENESLS